MTKRHVRLGDDDRHKPERKPRSKSEMMLADLTAEELRDRWRETQPDTFRTWREQMLADFPSDRMIDHHNDLPNTRTNDPNANPCNEINVASPQKTIREISQQDVLSPEDFAQVWGFFRSMQRGDGNIEALEDRMNAHRPFSLFGVQFEWRMGAYRRSHEYNPRGLPRPSR